VNLLNVDNSVLIGKINDECNDHASTYFYPRVLVPLSTSEKVSALRCTFYEKTNITIHE